ARGLGWGGVGAGVCARRGGPGRAAGRLRACVPRAGAPGRCCPAPLAPGASAHGVLRPAHGTHDLARAAAAIEQVATVGFQAAHADAVGQAQAFEHGAAAGIDAAQFALVVLPGAVPQRIAHPADPGDVAVRLQAAQDLAGLRIDLVDAAALVLAHPQVAVGPGQARLAAFRWRGNAVQHGAVGGVDLLDALFGDLVEVGAVEGCAGVAVAFDRARGLAGVRIDGEQARAGRGPDVAAVEAHAVHGLGAVEGAVLAHDLGGAGGSGRGSGPDVHGNLVGCAPGLAPWIRL